MSKGKIYPITEVSDLDMAFGGGAMKLMPPYSAIPDEFKDGRTKWNKLVSDWFFFGLKNLKLTPREGVDEQKAFRQIKTIIGSFDPQHEHKEAGCAYLLDQWFSDGTWERAK